MMIPSTHAEIEQLYLAAELAECRSLCITACNSGDGVTSFASALAERYLLAGHSTLLVDLNMFNPAFRNIEINVGESAEEWIEHESSHKLFVGLPVPNDRSTQLAYKDPKNMQLAVTKWLEKYDRVIVDTSPLLQVNRGNIPAQSVASACDETILVTLGSATNANQVSQAMTMLSAGKTHVLGCVLNLRDQPTLAEELSREVQRVKFIPKTWRDKMSKSLMKNAFLNLPV
ncbi:chromosome partitioning protein ParA [Vibrio tapetis subsp. quintayensis]|uniref:chromosome partitioning protein ParA n=1 Tax=Vibrio tapetis TaxID=52443 RepID=UPI0025B2A7E2|nr:chromosome partitioning protein ParA [Vibrio tapetis]MDN3680250.1 chromosome partitioning protein ParA [Vibrio tapetis subsp. quintayensis]